MKLIHQFKGQNAEKDVDPSLPVSFLLSNKAGSMLFFDARHDRTKYYANIKGKTIKVLHDINAGNGIIGINNKLHSVEIVRKDDEHELFVPHYVNGIVIRTKAQAPIQLVLELSNVNDKSKIVHWVGQEDGRVIVKATSDIGTFYAAIQGDNLAYKPSIDESFGRSRVLLDLLSTKITLAVAESENEAIRTTNHLFNNEQKIREMQEFYSSTPNRFRDPEAELAYACVLNCIDHAIPPANDMLQGMPFFSKITSHHKAIASHAFLLEGEFKTVKNALLKEIDLQSGNLAKGTASFEEATWPVLLLGKMLNDLSVGKKLYTYFKPEELKEIAKKVASIAELSEKVLAENPRKEDVKLESKTLLLSVYGLAYALTKSEKFGSAEKKLCEDAKARLYRNIAAIQSRGHAEKDDAKSIILSAYTYPQMLSKEEWEEAFDTLLDIMHNNFGTLQNRIARQNPEETLKLDLFGLKSMAAIVFSQTDAEHYEKHINTVLRESVCEVLYKGVIGRPSASFSDDVESESGVVIEDVHALNNALFLEMLRECA